MKLYRNSARVCIGATMVGLTLLTPSCKKVLDVVPYTSFSDATAFTTAARVDAAMNGVYDAAQSGFYAGGAVRGYPFGAANVEQGDMRGEDMLNDALFYQVTYESTQTTTSANQQYMFETLYSLINKANLMIEGVAAAVADGIITQAAADQYVAESRFLRAMAHHELLVHFARPYADGNGSKMGIIYRETGINSDAEVKEAKATKRTTVADNYTKLLADLDYAEQNLPATSSQRPFRATKGAAIALKTRVKLHMQDWAGVITEGNKIVSANAPFTSSIGGFALTANPGDPFVLPGTSVESIFSIRNAATDNGGVNGALPNMYGSANGGGRGLVRVSPIAYNLPEWPCDDKRRGLLTTYTAAGKTNYLTTKYKDPATSTDPAPQIRYAEVVLNLAEAEARQASGVSARGLALLNAIRGRATTPYAAFATKTDLIKAILIERRIEFLAEGRRWADIHRLALDATFGTGGIPAKIGTGSATTAMYSCGAGSTTYTTAVAAIPYADRRFIWPIPLTESQVNSSYEQNPGY
jgi:starch-binding outer membrane protein, SusD/RagB family